MTKQTTTHTTKGQTTRLEIKVDGAVIPFLIGKQGATLKAIEQHAGQGWKGACKVYSANACCMVVTSQSAKVARRAETRITELVQGWEADQKKKKKELSFQTSDMTRTVENLTMGLLQVTGSIASRKAGQWEKKKQASKKAQPVREGHKVQTTWRGATYSATVLQVRGGHLRLKYDGLSQKSSSWVHVDQVHHHTTPAKQPKLVAPLKLSKAAPAGFSVLANPRAA